MPWRSPLRRTPRLQDLVGKHLNIDKTSNDRPSQSRGISVTGFFMVGFPTETVAEMEATVQFALRSKLALTNFFMVIPQPETPIYALAAKENQQALMRQLAMMKRQTGL